MGNVGHTPGPLGFGYNDPKAPTRALGGRFDDAGGYVLRIEVTGVNVAADAPMIFAAPELLEAAQDTLEALTLLRMGLHDRAPEAIPVLDAHIDELRFAIAKASNTGEKL